MDDEPTCAWCGCPLLDEEDGFEFEPEEDHLPSRFYCSFDCLISAA